MARASVEFYEDEAGEWRWRVKGGNGEPVATGEGHSSERDAKRAFVGMIDVAEEALVTAMEEGDEILEALNEDRAGAAQATEGSR